MERIVGSEHLNFVSFLFSVVPCVYFLLNAKRVPSAFCDVFVEHLRGIANGGFARQKCAKGAVSDNIIEKIAAKYPDLSI